MSHRRLNPRIWDTDWLMLRGMTSALSRLVAEHVKAGDRVVDFGCGDMPYRSLVEASGATYLGADFEDHADLQISDQGKLPVEDGTIDVLISVQVLEHVRDLQAYFAEIARVLKPDGTLLLSTHGTWLYHPHPEDHRRWTRMGLVNDIEANGFGVKEIEAIVGPLATTTMIRSTGFVFFLRRLPLLGPALGGILAAVMNLRGLLEELATPEQIRNDNGCVYMTRCQQLNA